VLVNKSLAVGIFLILSTCGAIYTSPAVNRTSDNINVVKLTSRSVITANLTPYAPKQLPDVFNQASALDFPSPTGRVKNQTVQSDQPQTFSIPASIKPGPYRLGISDVVFLATPNPETTTALTALVASQARHQGYTIQDDGAISIPGIGRIVVAEQSIEEAEATVFQALAESQITPEFSLEVTEFNARSVSVGGAVNIPKLIPITIKPLTLQNALQLAGGVISSAIDYTNVQIFRDGKRYRFPLKYLQSQPDLQTYILQDGDSIIIENNYTEKLARINANSHELASLQIQEDLKREQSEVARKAFLTKLELGAIKRDYVFLAGEVAKQGRFALPFGNTASVADAIYSENGIRTREGNLSQIYIIRANSTDKPATAFHLDVKNAANLLLATKMQLRPNDIVFVAEQRVTAWNRVISQILPTFNVVNLSDLIAQ
jgi:polysaccharide export outer membrane protein